MSSSAVPTPEGDYLFADSSPVKVGVLLFLSSVFLYQFNIDKFPHPDELYHILAADGLLKHGEPRIADGIYERVFAHTWLISQLFKYLGESVFVARIPSILSMALSVSILYVWVRQAVNPRAALISAILYATSPFTIEVAQFARFYGLQTVFFLSGTLLLYNSLEFSSRYRRRRKNLIARRSSWGIGLAGLLLLAIAAYFQITTLIGVLGIAAWVVLKGLVFWTNKPNISIRMKWMFILFFTLVITLILLTAGHLNYLEQMLAAYRKVPLFNASQANNFLFYQAWYLIYYPTIWPAIGLILLVAVISKPKPALFCSAIFLSAIMTSSFAGQKSLRYIIYAQPFLFVIVGITVHHTIGLFTKKIVILRDRINAILPVHRSISQTVSNVLVASSLILLVIGNPANIRSASLLVGFTIPPEKKSVDWEIAEPGLRPWLDSADVIVTMTELEFLYYYGDYDLLLSASRLNEIPNGKDFSPDFRTGRPVVGSINAMETIFRCYEKGILVTNTRRWGDTNFISKPISNLIIDKTNLLDLPESSGVLAFTWDGDKRDSLQQECEMLDKTIL